MIERREDLLSQLQLMGTSAIVSLFFAASYIISVSIWNSLETSPSLCQASLVSARNPLVQSVIRFHLPVIKRYSLVCCLAISVVGAGKKEIITEIINEARLLLSLR